MIQSYSKDEVILITLPGDDADNPTIWEVTPITARVAAQEETAINFAASKEREKHLQYTLDVARRVMDQMLDRRLAARAAHIKRIYNAWPDGRTLEAEAEKINYLEGIPAKQQADIGEILTDGTRLRDLTFRGDHPAGVAAGKGETEEGGA